jgi:hypothetical protein
MQYAGPELSQWPHHRVSRRYLRRWLALAYVTPAPRSVGPFGNRVVGEHEQLGERLGPARQQGVMQDVSVPFLKTERE